MADALNEKDLSNLDKQTLIMLLITANKSISALQDQIRQMDKSISLLTEEVSNLRMHRFGRSTEKSGSYPDGMEQLSFSFNEAEAVVDCEPAVPEPEMEEIRSYRRKRKKGQRKEDLKDLPRTVVNHLLTDEELMAKFPDGKWKRLPDQVYERLEFHPASFEVIEHHVAVYAGTDNHTIIRADRPAGLFRDSVATPSLLAGIYTYKYVNSQPINRMAETFASLDVRIPTQTMCRWVINGSERYLKPLYNRLHEKLFGYHVIHADETPVEVVKDGRAAGAKSYMWVYRSGALEPHPFVLYEYQKTRKAEHPREFLHDYAGVVVTDGYQVYHTIDKERDNLTVAGCWAHARRGFAEVIKSAGKDDKSIKDSVAYKALQIIRTMYRYEESYRDLTPEKRSEERKHTIAPLVDAFFAYLKASEASVAPKSKTGKSIQYCLNQERYLRVFLTDGYIPMDNNAAERGIRTFCLGKKNWYTIDTVSGAQASAIAYSIAETARANSLKPYEYFKYVLEEIPKHGEFEDPSYLDDLLPWSDKLPESCRKQVALKPEKR